MGHLDPRSSFVKNSLACIGRTSQLTSETSWKRSEAPGAVPNSAAPRSHTWRCVSNMWKRWTGCKSDVV